MRRRPDLIIGIALGLALGLAIIVVFVFVFAEDTVDAPSLDRSARSAGTSAP